MKAKKLIAALLVVLMIAALLPVGALAEENRVSTLAGGSIFVNGQELSVNRTVKCGDGTAMLTEGTGNNYVLTLNNATITQVATAKYSDGVTQYAGIVNPGYKLIIKTYGKNSIVTSATASDGEMYDGIYSKGQATIMGDGLSITGFDIGIACDSELTVSNCTVSECCTGIYAVSLILNGSNNINANGRVGVFAARNLTVNGENTVSISDEEARTSALLEELELENVIFGVVAIAITINNDAALNVTVSADITEVEVDEKFGVAGVYSNTTLACTGKLSATINLKDSGKTVVAAIAANTLTSDAGGFGTVNAVVNKTGSTGTVHAIEVSDVQMIDGAIVSTVTGASTYDVAFYSSSATLTDNVIIHATVDAKRTYLGPLMLGGSLNADGEKTINGELVCPAGGSYKRFLNFFYVIDADGARVNDVVLNFGHVHGYTAEVVAPTCTDEGYTVYTCTCGDSYKDAYVNALGHSYNEGVCTRCGAADPDYSPLPDNPFVDVGEDDYFCTPVLWAFYHEPQITNGMDKTHFAPNSTCTRAQVVTFLWRAMGCPEVGDVENPFYDVKSGQWYTDAVLWAVKNGITNGTSATTFSPNAKVTRAQTVTFLYRAAKGEPVNEANPFEDVAAGQYYTDAVLWAVANDITNGTSPTTFSPDKTCTRVQIVTFLYRFMGE